MQTEKRGWLASQSWRNGAFAVVLACSVVADLGRSALAQEEIPDSPGKKVQVEKGRKNSWKWRVEASVEAAYDDNVFRLSDGQADRLEAGRGADEASGRFDDMESVEDFIFSPAARVAAETRGFGREQFRIRPRARYEYFFENTKKSHPEVGIDFLHGLGSGRSIELDFSYAHDVFTKNYLSDAVAFVDSVAADERVYDPGEYDAVDIELAYRQRLWKGKGVLETLHARVLAGYRSADFDDPFDNRDRDGFRAGLGLDAEFGDLLEVGVHYLFEYVDAPGKTEVVLRDEPVFGVDFDSDGDTANDNVRTEQRVDRSRLEQSAGARVALKPGKDWTLWLGYDVLFQDFRSDEPFDISYKDREDWRHRVRAGVQWRFARHWALALEGQRIEETVNKRVIDVDEEREYERYIASATISCRF